MKRAAAGGDSTPITIDGTKGGRTFDGVGAISGGGVNSVQLISYREPQRSDILDLLFKPGAGAALQILKVEIGGDAFSSCGAEPSHEHSRGVVNPNGGYEWWLMQQAKARNPGIRFYGLAWAAPGWIGGGAFWCKDMIDYLVGWVDCASSHSRWMSPGTSAQKSWRPTRTPSPGRIAPTGPTSHGLWPTG